MAKRSYSDNEKAAALLTLESNGGNLSRTSRELNIPISTLGEWRDGRAVPDVAEIRNENRTPLVDRLMNELTAALNLLPEKRSEASYSDLMRGVGILTDKVQLLSGADTARVRATVHVTYGADTDGSDDALD